MSKTSMPSLHCMRVALALWLAVAAASALADDPSAANVDAPPAEDGAALFSPLAGAGAPLLQPRAADPEPQQGDWALPLLAATAGFAAIGVLMRKMID